MFTMEFTHQLFLGGPKEQIPAMNLVKSIIRKANFSGVAFPFSKGYAAWETDEVCTVCISVSIFLNNFKSLQGAKFKSIVPNKTWILMSLGLLSCSLGDPK